MHDAGRVTPEWKFGVDRSKIESAWRWYTCSDVIYRQRQESEQPRGAERGFAGKSHGCFFCIILGCSSALNVPGRRIQRSETFASIRVKARSTIYILPVGFADGASQERQGCYFNELCRCIVSNNFRWRQLSAVGKALRCEQHDICAPSGKKRNTSIHRLGCV